MPLLAAADFDDLPIEPVARWLQLRDILEERIDLEYDLAAQNQDSPSQRSLYEYYTVIKQTAPSPHGDQLPVLARANLYEEIEYFRAEIAALAANLLFNSTARAPAEVGLLLSVKISDLLIEEVERLRKIVRSSELEKARKERVLSLLAELLKEIETGKLNYKKFTSLVGSIAIGVTTLTAFAAEVPIALTNIQKLVGYQQEAAEQKALLLEAPNAPAVPMLPTPEKKQLPHPDTYHTTET